jgi:hypothetical protein
MDNCFTHTKPEVLTILKEHSVKGIPFPRPTTRRFHALDLSPFGVLQRKLQYRLPLGDDERTFGVIQKAFHSVKQTFLPDNVRNAFEMLRFKFNIAKSPDTLLLREEKLRGSPGFQEMRDVDGALDQLSKRLGEATSGWSNDGDYIR